jgi:hypothetical protein
LEAASPTVTVAGRRLQPTAVFDTYWRFAAERQRVYLLRAAGHPGPWTDDPILSCFRFTNCYRASDRVSQFCIRHVAYAGEQTPEEVVFRVLLFKMFNKIDTWRLLVDELGPLSWSGWRASVAEAVLDAAFAAGRRLYSAAYVIPPPSLGAVRKHGNHLRLLVHMLADDLPRRIVESRSLREAFLLLRGYPAIGDFLAYQFLIDLNYSSVLNFAESEFVVAGPGARDGIRKCFGPAAAGIESEIIRYMADTQQEHFARLRLDFASLGGRPLQLIDCQNLFCEVDKYARVAHPDVSSISGRTRIKQHYRVDPTPMRPWFPPKWRINAAVARQLGSVAPG